MAATLGNRPATCRKYYIHPGVVRAYEQEALADLMNAHPREERSVPRAGLSSEEKATLAVLQWDLRRQAKLLKSA